MRINSFIGQMSKMGGSWKLFNLMGESRTGAATSLNFITSCISYSGILISYPKLSRLLEYNHFGRLPAAVTVNDFSDSAACPAESKAEFGQERPVKVSFKPSWELD
jgi:hypothetical protein